jgi:hypothetical protein
MVITPRFSHRLHELLEQKFAGDPDVIVYRDRRIGQRRRKTMMREMSRRRPGDRRGRTRDDVAWLIATDADITSAGTPAATN